MSHRILVTGSRNWSKYRTIASEIVHYMSENAEVITDSTGVPINYDITGFVIVHGHCPTGADAWADEFALLNHVNVERHEADWHEHGKKAGMIRNASMVDTGANVCLGFINPCTSPTCRITWKHGSHGTTDCLRKAHAADIPVRVFTEDEFDTTWFRALEAEMS